MLSHIKMVIFNYKSVVNGDIAPRRLITTGLNGAVIEWDLINLQPRKIIDLGDAGIWDSVSTIENI